MADLSELKLDVPAAALRPALDAQTARELRVLSRTIKALEARVTALEQDVVAEVQWSDGSVRHIGTLVKRLEALEALEGLPAVKAAVAASEQTQ